MAGRTGSSNPNWKGGTTPERQRVYAGATWRRLRRQLLTRAACMCEVCGQTDGLHMHHVKSWAEHPELRLELDNLMLLCQPCHADAHRKGGAANE
jgi:5-methylcytosine-specific restriction protein A